LIIKYGIITESVQHQTCLLCISFTLQLLQCYWNSQVFIYIVYTQSNHKQKTKTVNVCLFVCFMVFNATFSNIAVISWRSALLVEEIGRPEENHRPVTSFWQTLSHNAVDLALIEIRTHNISGDRYWLHCKFNYHTITATTPP
jgi:hypothetical protein